MRRKRLGATSNGAGCTQHIRRDERGRLVVTDPEDRFLPHVEIQANGCWHWTGSKDRRGYGWFSGWGEKKAHRAAWVAARGPIPFGACVLHHCDNPSCVNPAHLYLGDHTANARDKVARGRARGINRGEDNGLARLSEADVRGIRHRYSDGAKLTELAREFGVSHSTIFRIVHRLCWAHVI